MLTRWLDMTDTLSMMNALERQMNRLYESPRDVAADRTVSFGAPLLRDAGESLVLAADLPGFAQEDIQLTIEADQLALKAERKPAAPEGYQVVRAERPRLSFSRTYDLPCRVDAEHAEARLENGVLVVTLPKAAEAKPRRIQVTAGA